MDLAVTNRTPKRKIALEKVSYLTTLMYLAKNKGLV